MVRRKGRYTTLSKYLKLCVGSGCNRLDIFWDGAVERPTEQFFILCYDTLTVNAWHHMHDANWLPKRLPPAYR